MGASRERVWTPRCTGCFEEFTDTLLCGDPFTQPGASHPALTRDDIVAPSEAMRRSVDCSGHVRDALRLLEKLAATSPPRARLHARLGVRG